MAAVSHHSPAPTTLEVPSFYMRELPKEKLVSYESPNGKELFKAALLEGGLEAFFPLSQQFLTQDEPAFCGLGTLCMILNALKIDPETTWRKPWRWFKQEMLDCCRPLEWVRKNGITLAEFTCLAKCNGLDAITQYANKTPFEKFEQAVKDCIQSTEMFIAILYSRASLGQTGSGHFSPAGGYTSKNGGMVLILDVARFKYPSYWVPIRALYDSLIPLTQLPVSHGYSILRWPSIPKLAPALLMLNATTPTWPSLYQPLAQIASTVRNYVELVSILIFILQSPSGFPTVTSRDEGIYTNTLIPFSHTPSFDAVERAKARSECRRGVVHLRRYLSEKSVLYSELTTVDDLWRTEITIYLLALLSSRDILECMSDALREEVIRNVQKDLQDGTIGHEVDMMRRQIESLTECSLEDGGYSRPAGSYCRKRIPE